MSTTGKGLMQRPTACHRSRKSIPVVLERRLKLLKQASKVEGKPSRRRPPGKTPEARESQLVAMAVDLAEKQIAEGTASSQVITHFLKLGSTKERLEKELLAQQSELLRAKTEALQSAKRVEELYKSALDAMRLYSGNPVVRDEE